MLKKQPGFVLKKIKDSYYLLPFGQQVADQKKGLFLNETGAFLWECLCDTTNHAELVKKLAGHYQLEESDFPMLEEDVTLFLNQLTSFDILKDDGDSADSLSSRFALNTPLCLSSSSTNVVLPWSTCAIMAMLRTSSLIINNTLFLLYMLFFVFRI